MNKAIFFDRDGVLTKDNGLVTCISQIEFSDDLFTSLRLLNGMEFKFFMITNQAVVARGMLEERELEDINRYIAETIYDKTLCKIEKCYFCPHHPNADLEKYRKNCECRKPKPGMLLQAAGEFDIDLSQSYMIGDRMSDVIAGAKAACKTILLQTGKHIELPIESDAFDSSIKPDFTCDTLAEAVTIILKNK